MLPSLYSRTLSSPPDAGEEKMIVVVVFAVWALKANTIESSVCYTDRCDLVLRDKA